MKAINFLMKLCVMTILLLAVTSKLRRKNKTREAKKYGEKCENHWFKNECGTGLVCGHHKSETDEKTCLHGNQQKCNVDKTKEKCVLGHKCFKDIGSAKISEDFYCIDRKVLESHRVNSKNNK
jgi:hypothetical protein